MEVVEEEGGPQVEVVGARVGASSESRDVVAADGEGEEAVEDHEETPLLAVVVQPPVEPTGQQPKSAILKWAGVEVLLQDWEQMLLKWSVVVVVVEEEAGEAEE